MSVSRRFEPPRGGSVSFPRKRQRIVKAAMIERIGPVTSAELLKMSDDSWVIIRDRITDHRSDKDGLGSGPINFRFTFFVDSSPHCFGGHRMNDQFWLTRAQLKRIERHFPLSHGVPQVDGLRT